MSHRARRLAGGVALACAVALLAAGCGGRADARWTGAPQGAEMRPDFAPMPPEDIHTKQVDDSWTVEFSSSLVNVGAGDFHATANRSVGDAWVMTQDIEHVDGGASHVVSEAEPVWGGDGHEHWHISRYVTYYLHALDAAGQETGEPRTDHKVGFCIYDFQRSELGIGPEESVYKREGCGEEDADHLAMGLSVGWSDDYHWSLPGQSINIDGLEDGDYRIYAMADEDEVFVEESRDNNRTWVEFALSTNEDGLRTALVSEVGPRPE